MGNEKPKTGLELIRESARAAQSGIVLDKQSLERGVERSIELLQHMPEPTRAGVMQGQTVVLVDFTGGLHVFQKASEN